MVQSTRPKPLRVTGCKTPCRPALMLPRTHLRIQLRLAVRSAQQHAAAAATASCRLPARCCCSGSRRHGHGAWGCVCCCWCQHHVPEGAGCARHLVVAHQHAIIVPVRSQGRKRGVNTSVSLELHQLPLVPHRGNAALLTDCLPMRQGARPRRSVVRAASTKPTLRWPCVPPAWPGWPAVRG